MKHLLVFCVLLSFGLAGALSAQTSIDLGGLEVDGEEPIEVTADNLTVDQETGQAVFTGQVIVVQGALRLTANMVEVIYDTESSDISRLIAEGDVTLVTETDAAEAQEADYDVLGGTLDLRGDVLLTQGQSAISAEEMTINTEDGSAVMSGRVSTVLQQGQSE